MLELTDPLWEKLDDANRDRHIPKVLSELAEAWNDETAIRYYGTASAIRRPATEQPMR
jgi:hypothetical protein